MCHLSSLPRNMRLAIPLMVLKMEQSSKKVMADYNIHNDSITQQVLDSTKRESFILH